MTNEPETVEATFLEAEREGLASHALLRAGHVEASRKLATRSLEALRGLAEPLGVPIPGTAALPLDDAAAASSLLDVAERTARAIEARVLPPPTRRARRRRAAFAYAFAGLSAVVALLVAFDLRPGAHAVASSVFDGAAYFDGSRAVDGNPGTEWQTPDHVNGFLDVHLVPARTVESIRVWNGHNRWYVDRAVRSFRIELVRDGAIVSRREGTFAALLREPTSVVVRFGREPGIDHVRFVVTSHFGLGPALAELEIR